MNYQVQKFKNASTVSRRRFTEKIWKRTGFFGDPTADFTINKANFLENTLTYAKQGNRRSVKDDFAIYLDYVVLGQLIPTKNSPQNLEDYECLPDEVKLVVLLYDMNSGKFLGLDKRLAFIMVRANQTCFIRSLKLFSRIYLAEPALKKHQQFILDQQMTNGYSMLFFYLPSTTDHSKSINQDMGKSLFTQLIVHMKALGYTQKEETICALKT